MPAQGAEDAAVKFVISYDEWAQAGYTDPIPEALHAVSSEDMFDLLKEDQQWQLGGSIQQHGAIEVLESEVVESSADEAVVTVTFDASAVSVTAEGKETWVDYSRPVTTLFNLEMSDTWRVSSTDGQT